MKKLTRKQNELLQVALAKHNLNPKCVRHVDATWKTLDEEGKPLYPEGKRFSALIAKRLYKNRWKGRFHQLDIFEDGQTCLQIDIGLQRHEY